MLNGKFLPKVEELVQAGDGAIQPVMFFYAIEGASLAEIARGHGYEVRCISWDGEVNEDGWYDAYGEDPEKVLTEWQPMPPEGFTFGGKWHTEDGIEACFLKKLEG